jgi:hypothetical protein
MKTAQIALMMYALGLVASNGAATVYLNNKYAEMPIYLYETGTLATGDDVLYVMIYVNGIDSLSHTLYKVGTTGNSANDYVFKVDEQGYFDGGVGIVPGLKEDGSVVDLTVAAWLGTASDPKGYPGAVRGYSATWSQLTGTWDPNSGTTATGTELLVPNSVIVGSSAIPETNTVTLGLLGGAALLTTNKVAKTIKGTTKTPPMAPAKKLTNTVATVTVK